VRFQWSLVQASNHLPVTCAQAGADMVFLLIDTHSFLFPCTDNMGTASPVTPGVHTVEVGALGATGRVLVDSHLPSLDPGCGAVDLGRISFQFGP
jgi:hypothetical protein